jgi:uncharacterized YccA/Bax inhibitor family protein
MPSSNPVLNQSTFAKPATGVDARPMTLEGVVHRTLLFLLLAVGTAAATWIFLSTHETATMPVLMVGMIGGLGAAIVATLNKRSVPITGTIYVLFEGLVLGAITLYFERAFPGIAVQAVCLTFGISFALLGAYQFGWIKVTQTFRSIVICATGGVFLIYLISMLCRLFFHFSIPLIYSSGPVGIIFSLFVIALASMNLVLDFEFVATGVANRAPKWMEWYAAFSLMVTLIWLYLEILRLLAKLTRNR